MPSVTFNTAYRNLLSSAQSKTSRDGKSIDEKEMAAVKAILEAKPGGITAADRAKVAKDFGTLPKDFGATKIYNEILGFSGPVDPPIVALYGVAINDAVRSGDRARMERMLEIAEASIGRATAGPGGMALASAASAGSRNPTAESLTEVQGAVAALRAALQQLDG